MNMQTLMPRFLLSAALQFLIFGSLSAFFLAQGPEQAWPVIALFAIGELGGTASLCGAIVEHLQKARLPDPLMTAVVGFIVSHLGILTVLHSVGPFSGHAPHVPGQSSLAWMELTLRVGLIMVLALTAGVLLSPRIRKHTPAGAKPVVTREFGVRT